MADKPQPKEPTAATDRDKFGWREGDVIVKQPPPRPPSPSPPPPPKEPRR